MAGNKFKFGNLNVRSLTAHFPEVCDLVRNNNYDVLCITESWLKPAIPSYLVQIPGYELIREDRIDRVGGGVAIYIHKNYYFTKYSFLTCRHDVVENLWITLKYKRLTFIVGVVYRPPSCSVADSVTQYHAMLSEVTPIFDFTIVTGDVNVNMLDLTNPLTDCFDSYGMTQIIDGPTRVTKSTATLLDPIIY